MNHRTVYPYLSLREQLLLGVVFLILGAMPEVVAEPVMGLDEALELTRQNNPELRSLEQDFEAARHRIPRAASLPDPRLQVMHFVESVQTRTGPQENALSLSQTIPWPGTLRGRKDMAAAAAEAVWYANLARQLQVMRDVSLDYYTVAGLIRASELTGQSLELLRQLEPVVEERVRSGGDLNALLRLNVETGRLQSKKDSLDQQIESGMASLTAKIGLDGAGSLGLPVLEMPEMEHFDGPVLIRRLEAGHPELKAIALQEKSAEAGVEVARLAGYPDMTVGLNYIQIGEYAGSMLPDSGKDPWALTFSVNLPLFREKRQAERSEAIARVRSLESRYDNRRNLLVGSLRSALSRHEDALSRLTLYRETLLPLAEQALSISRTGYEGGRISILEVIDSERSLLELQLENWKAAEAARKSEVIVASLASFADTQFENGDK